MVDRLWWEDMCVGRKLELGSCEVTREEVIAFATRYDPQPYHIDDAVAAAHPVFDRLSASGIHTLAMTSRMTFDGFVRIGLLVIAGGGIDSLRFERPVYPGDRLTAIATVQDARILKSRGDRGILHMKTTTRNQDQEAVLIYSGTMLVERRHPSQ